MQFQVREEFQDWNAIGFAYKETRVRSRLVPFNGRLEIFDINEYEMVYIKVKTMSKT